MLQFKYSLDHRGNLVQIYDSIANWYRSLPDEKRILNESPQKLLHFRLGPDFGVFPNIRRDVNIRISDSQLDVDVSIELAIDTDYTRKLHKPHADRIFESLENTLKSKLTEVENEKINRTTATALGIAAAALANPATWMIAAGLAIGAAASYTATQAFLAAEEQKSIMDDP